MDAKTMGVIRQKLGISENDSQEKLERYKKFKKAYTPIFLGVFALSVMLVFFAHVKPDLVFSAMFVNILVYGHIDRKVKVYEVGEIIKKDSFDIEQVKKRLLMENVSDVSKKHKKYSKLRKVFLPIYILLWFAALCLFVAAILGKFDLRGITTAVWFAGINYMLYDAIKYRINVYEVGMILEKGI
jgi:hypothetical protein